MKNRKLLSSIVYRLLCSAAIVFIVALQSVHAENPFVLFEQGSVDEARRGFQKNLDEARAMSDNPLLFWRDKQTEVWKALFHYAWFLDQTGDFKKSIEMSNEALDIATKQQSEYRIGRTLGWLGHAYAYKGNYTLALEFFDAALEIGKKNGRIVHPMIWGLSTQEKGAILFRMGDVKTAKEIIQETATYARSYGIDGGYAESALHLAEIAVHEGNIGEALRYAKEAEQAAERCRCNPQLYAHAILVQAEVLYEKYKNKLAHDVEVQAAIERAKEAANKLQVTHLIALTKLLESKLIQDPFSTRKEELLNDAFQMLETIHHEDRGRAAIESGRLYLDQHATDLAKYYLQRGFKINEESFRLVDNAYALPSFEELTRQLGGDEQARLKELQTALDRALEVKGKPLLFSIYRDLSYFCEDIGYYQLADQYGRKALHTASLILEEESDEYVHDKIQQALIDLKEHLINMSRYTHQLPTNPE